MQHRNQHQRTGAFDPSDAVDDSNFPRISHSEESAFEQVSENSGEYPESSDSKKAGRMDGEGAGERKKSYEKS